MIASGLTDQGRYGVLFAACAILAVPLGLAAALARARWPSADAPAVRP